MGRRENDTAEKAEAQKGRARELTAKGRIGAAAREYLAVLELVPGDVYARQRAAELFARVGEKGRAIEHYLCLVGKKIFAYFLDNHHGDEMIVASVRGDRADNERLVKKDPKRYCSPAYIGKRGWLGIRLEGGKADWEAIAGRVKASYEGVAPKTRTTAATTDGQHAIRDGQHSINDAQLPINDGLHSPAHPARRVGPRGARVSRRAQGPDRGRAGRSRWP